MALGKIEEHWRSSINSVHNFPIKDITVDILKVRKWQPAISKL
jgi:hypothetical protein